MSYDRTGRSWRSQRPPRQQFQLKQANRFASLAEKCAVDQEERQLTSAVCGSAEEVCPIIRHRTQPWISKACIDLIDQRKRAKLVIRERYAQLKRATRCQLKPNREAYWSTVSEQAEDAARKREFRTLYATLRRYRTEKNRLAIILEADGSFTRLTEEHLQRWKDFFEGTYNHTAPEDLQVAPPYVLYQGQSHHILRHQRRGC